jgi:hypothetical protein
MRTMPLNTLACPTNAETPPQLGERIAGSRVA